MSKEEVFKAVASDTKRKIIKELSQGSRTPSDLGKILNKNKSTIVEHLNKLRSVGLVDKTERPGKKWVFYNLTEKGESIVSSKTNRIVIILSITFLSLIGGILSLYNYLKPVYFTRAFAEKSAGISVMGDANNLIMQNPAFLYLSIGLFSATAIGVAGIFLIKKRKILEV